MTRRRSRCAASAAREIVLHGVRDRGRADRRAAEAAGWRLSIAGDLSDIAATTLGRAGLPDGSAGEDGGRRGRLGGADRRGARRRVIAYTRRGSGPPLVLLHALGTDRHMWDPVLDRLRSSAT